MKHTLSVPNTACVKCQSWGKLLALNIPCFVVNAVSVTIIRFFSKGFVDKVSGNWKKWLKKVQTLFLDNTWNKRGKRAQMVKKKYFLLLF